MHLGKLVQCYQWGQQICVPVQFVQRSLAWTITALRNKPATESILNHILQTSLQDHQS
uniref:Uncharacterized protein n=1 Tax=Arundo donax TaxID=35708 RepID=A0A0A9E8R4_ARUDO